MSTSAIETVLSKLAKVRQAPGGFSASCPGPNHVNGDRHPSLSVSEGDDGRVLLHCHAGCPVDEITAAVGLSTRDLFAPTTTAANGQRRTVARYPYVDEEGTLLFHVHRTAPKGFYQVPANGKRGAGAMDGARLVPYRLPEVLAARDRGETVFVVEGEKDADALVAAGRTATCNPGGAGKWSKLGDDVRSCFKGADVIVVADDDRVGWTHARQVARSLHGVAADVTVTQPGTGHKDIAEHLGAGLAVDDLELVASTDNELGCPSLDEWLTAGGRNPTTTDGDGSVEQDPQLYRSTVLADVTPERVSWLWPGRLPAGKLVVLDGDPSVGKSTLVLDLAARVTTGRPMPGEDLACVPPSSVVLLAAEDGLADTIRPRLDAAGADPARVHHLDAVAHVDDDGNTTYVPPSIPEDLAALEKLIVDTGAVLVVIDVLMAYLSGRHDSHRDQDVRRALARLAEIADRTGACIVLLRHLRKTRGAAMYAGGGSIGIIGVARSALIAAVDPTDDSGTRRVLAVSKSNLAAAPSALGYRLTTDEHLDVARIDWLGATSHTADDLMAAPDAEDRSALDEAVEWLLLALAGGGRPKREIITEARPEGITQRTLERAAKRTGVEVTRDGSRPGSPSIWTLPTVTPTTVAPRPLAQRLQASDQEEQPESASVTPSLCVGVTPPEEGLF
jgi:putative DNA primase/helicase